MPVALVTGASRGIGAHLTRALVGAGWQVAALATNTDLLRELAEAAREEEPSAGDDASSPRDEAHRRGAPAHPDGKTPGPVLPIGCDVTDVAQVDSAVEQTLAAYGRIDLLINNAGMNHTEELLWEIDAQEWWDVIRVNVKGPYLLTRAVVPHMIAAGGGRIININSGSGTRDSADSSGYNASKSALFRITGATAAAGAAHGVYAFDLAPGVVRTDMTAVMKAHADRTEWTSPEQVNELALSLATGELDAYSGRMVRAGADTVEQLRDQAPRLGPDDRKLRLVPWGEDDPLA